MKQALVLTLAMLISQMAVVTSAPVSSDEGGTKSGRLKALRIFEPNAWPRVFFFRYSERPDFLGIEYKTYENWESVFQRAMGIMGKALDEEKLNREERNTVWFTQFKREHPDQIVLEHLNGRARAWQYETGTFFPGHWLYGEGTKVLSNILAEKGVTELCVEDSSLFYESNKKHHSRADIVLCLIDEDGKLDWSTSEQVHLVSKDDEKGVIRVQRGYAGSKPRDFPAGRTWAAPHLIRGPFENRLLWKYNFSTRCPCDENGRSCVDVLVENTVAKFLSGGILEAFDGLEFDAMWGEIDAEADCDGDGKADAGFFDGVNTFDLGVYEYLHQLRDAFGSDRIILADGGKSGHQRGFGVLNGIECEAFPARWDDKFQLWSAGLNVQKFWRQNCMLPSLNYLCLFTNARKNQKADVDTNTKRYFSRARLTIAAALMVDAAISQYSPPPYYVTEEGEFFDLWDELKMGCENRLGWLGQPLASARRLAFEHPDVLGKAGTPPSSVLLNSLKVDEEARTTLDGDSICLKGTGPDVSHIRFTLMDIPVANGETLLTITLRGSPIPGYPNSRPRLVVVEPEGKQYFFDKANESLFSWIGEKDFTSTFYYRGAQSKRLSFAFEIEGEEPVWISSLAAYTYPDVFVKEYEHGIVLGNPSFHEYTFDLDALFPGRKLRRLTASSNQDDETNNGMPASGKVTLKKLDALFLVKD